MSLRIAMLGTRGLPATFGGVEHHVEEIGSRLVARGHEVTVYSQSAYSAHAGSAHITEHLGMQVVTMPTVNARGLEALAHSAMSTAHGLRSGHDVFHYHAVGPGLMTPLARYGGRAAVVQTVHGLDADRAKWGGGARSVLTLATWLSARVPDRTLTVSRDLADHYAAHFDRACDYVPNGVSLKTSRAPRLITEKYGLSGRDYVLFVGRMVPEKRPDLLIEAFSQIDTDQRLVLVGGSSHTDEFVEELRLRAARDPRVIMPDYVYGEELDEFFTNATTFVQPSALEGLPLTLLEAMGSGLPVVTSDIRPHLEIIGGSERAGARVFAHDDVASLRAALERSLAWPDQERTFSARLRADVVATYDWSACVDRLEQIYTEAVGTVARRRWTTSAAHSGSRRARRERLTA